MPHLCGSRFRRGIPVEFIEADVEIGFSLVDLAETELNLGDGCSASRALRVAEDVFNDIQQRLLRIGAFESGPFAPLVEELRRAIDQAKIRTAQA